MIKISKLSKTYNLGKNNEVRAINNITLTLPDTGMVFVVGKSGCGKTTLLNILSGIDKADHGELIFDDVSLSNNTETEWDDFRSRNIGIVFQEHNLLEDLNVFDNIALSAKISGIMQSEAVQDIEKVLKFVELEGYEKRGINDLSGGQKQRVSIARALIKKSQLLLADEPTGNLDSKTSKTIFELLKKISQNKLVFVISHDEANAKKYADRIIQMSDGEIISDTLNDIEKIADAKVVGANRIKNTDTAKSKPLLLRDIIKFSKSFSKRKVRNALTIVMFSLTIFIFFVVSVFQTFDYRKTLTGYLNQHKFNYLTLSQHVSFTDSFYDKQESELSKGKFLRQNIDKTIGNNYSAGVVSSALKHASTEKKQNINIAYISENTRINRDLSFGRLPQRINEIAITDYIAKILELPTDQESIILRDTQEIKVCGIIKTDYIKSNIEQKIRSSSMTPHCSYRLENEFLLTFMHTDNVAVMQNSDSALFLTRVRFFEASTFALYINSYMYFENLATFSDGYSLIWGRMPESNDEVIVSSLIAQAIGYDGSSLRASVFNLPDLFNQKYNNYFSDEINLFDYFPNGIKVVGIHSGSPDVYVAENIYDSMSVDFYNNYYFERYISFINGSYRSTVNKFSKENLRWTMPAAEETYSFASLTKTLSLWLWLLMIIFALLTIIMIISSLGYSIKDNTKKIGILRGLGIRRFDTMKIFLVEAVLITLLSIFIGIAMLIPTVIIVNKTLMIGMAEISFKLITINWQTIILVGLFTVTTSILATVFPLYKFSKKKPIDVIYNR